MMTTLVPLTGSGSHSARKSHGWRRSVVGAALTVLAACILTASSAWAQTPVPSPTPANTKLGWTHDGINTDRYLLIVDSGTPADLGRLTPVTGQEYEIPFPALTPGQHTLLVCAENIAGRACSAPFPVSVIVQPAPPGSLRIVIR